MVGRNFVCYKIDQSLYNKLLQPCSRTATTIETTTLVDREIKISETTEKVKDITKIDPLTDIIITDTMSENLDMTMAKTIILNGKIRKLGIIAKELRTKD